MQVTNERTTDAAFLSGTDVTQEAFPPLPLCWPALSAQEREEQFEALNDWAYWLAGCYALDHRTIPPCWPEHGALVEELSALRTAWLTAFAVTSAGDAPLAWHAHFAASRQRLADWVSRMGCRAGEHRPDSFGSTARMGGHRAPPPAERGVAASRVTPDEEPDRHDTTEVPAPARASWR